MTYDMEHLFICLFSTFTFFFGELPVKVFDLYIFFGEVSIKVFDLFLNLTVFLLLTFKSCLFIFGSSTLSVFFKYLLSGCDLSFSSLDSVFCRAEIFNFRFFPQKYVLIYIPSNMAQGFPFLHILANICYLLSFGWLAFWQEWNTTISLWF